MMLRKYVYYKQITFRQMRVQIEWRSTGLLGRFGGGWNWRLGVQWSTWRHVVISLFVLQLRLDCPEQEAKDYG